MSRAYRMMITVNGFDFNRYDDIDEAIRNEWTISHTWPEHPTPKDIEVDWQGDCRLCGGESEDEFAVRVTRAIWKANGKICNVTIHATYMEEMPCESFYFGKDVGNDEDSQEIWDDLQLELEKNEML